MRYKNTILMCQNFEADRLITFGRGENFESLYLIEGDSVAYIDYKETALYHSWGELYSDDLRDLVPRHLIDLAERFNAKFDLATYQAVVSNYRQSCYSGVSSEQYLSETLPHDFPTTEMLLKYCVGMFRDGNVLDEVYGRGGKCLIGDLMANVSSSSVSIREFMSETTGSPHIFKEVIGAQEVSFGAMLVDSEILLFTLQSRINDVVELCNPDFHAVSEADLELSMSDFFEKAYVENAISDVTRVSLTPSTYGFMFYSAVASLNRDTGIFSLPIEHLYNLITDRRLSSYSEGKGGSF